MSNIEQPNLPISNPATAPLAQAVNRWGRLVVDQLNRLSNGQAVAVTNAATVPPTVAGPVPFARGDVIKNSAPSELGAAGSKYVLYGWECVVAGNPGTWLQMRFLTGN